MALLRLTWALVLASSPSSSFLSLSPAAASGAVAVAGAATAGGSKGTEVPQAVRDGLSDACLKAACNLLLSILQSPEFQVTSWRRMR